jgi:hypothetical protein
MAVGYGHINFLTPFHKGPAGETILSLWIANITFNTLEIVYTTFGDVQNELVREGGNVILDYRNYVLPYLNTSTF